jgi:glycosyltransferase involved in cell wall biosynthesis
MLSLFMPAYNEEDVLEENVGKAVDALSGIEFELFIVDDGSTDDTGRIASRLQAGDARIKHLRFEDGPSRRENMARSFAQGRGEVMAFMDSDLSEGHTYLTVMLDRLKDADIVVGTRFHPESQVKRRLWRQAFTHLANLFLKVAFGSTLTDHQCGLKAFRRTVLLGLVEEAGFDERGTRGFAWDSEILLRAQRHGFRIAEVPVIWEQSGKSSVNILRDYRMIPYMLALKHRIR